jgi:leader peptidase (prepilin peptidase)/N-methyltransferase
MESRLVAAAAVIVGVLGLVIGSFLNVVIARLPEGLSIVSPRSRCPKCHHQITWYENIPVLSWIALRARCSQCKAPISIRYPLVELLTAALFLGCFWRFELSYPLVLSLVFVSLLVPLSLIDLDHWILPFEITLPGIALGILLSIPVGKGYVIASVLGAAIAYCAFFAMEWLGRIIFKKEALGGGDKYLLAMIGSFLTYRPLLGVIFLASLQGGLVGMLLLAVRGRAGPAPKDEAKPPRKNNEPQDEATLSHFDPETTMPGLDPERTIPPSEPPAESGAEPSSEEEDDWQPGPTNIPFGPWLSVAALQLLYFGPWLNAHLPPEVAWMLTGG